MSTLPSRTLLQYHQLDSIQPTYDLVYLGNEPYIKCLNNDAWCGGDMIVFGGFTTLDLGCIVITPTLEIWMISYTGVDLTYRWYT